MPIHSGTRNQVRYMCMEEDTADNFNKNKPLLLCLYICILFEQSVNLFNTSQHTVIVAVNELRNANLLTYIRAVRSRHDSFIHI